MKNIFTKIAATAVTTVAFSGAIAVDALAATMKPTPLIFDDDGSQEMCRLMRVICLHTSKKVSPYPNLQQPGVC